jgi:hypothetical protein
LFWHGKFTEDSNIEKSERNQEKRGGLKSESKISGFDEIFPGGNYATPENPIN